MVRIKVTPMDEDEDQDKDVEEIPNPKSEIRNFLHAPGASALRRGLLAQAL